jgi:hypothetical protein
MTGHKRRWPVLPGGAVGQTIGLCRLSAGERDMPQKAMACPTSEPEYAIPLKL